MPEPTVESPQTVGILGAGKLGTVLAPGAEVRTTGDLVAEADVVILALPLGSVRALAADGWAGRLVVDATNHWEPVDGPLPEFTDDPRGSSRVVADLLPGARVVKSFNHIGYHDLDERGRPRGAADRVAVAVAGDDPADVAVVAALVDSLGFDPLLTGGLESGRRFQAHTPAFGYPLKLDRLREAVAAPG